MTMAALDKVSVMNPLTLRNKVGGELADLFEARGIKDYENLLGIKDLRSKEKLSDKVLVKSSKILESPDLTSRLIDFQREYLEEKPRYVAAYKESMKNYGKLKEVIPLLCDEFNDGCDRLDDILDYFGVDTEEEVLEASEKQAALYRTQNGMEADPVNLYAWLRRGELDFKAMDLPEYDEKGLMNWIEAREWESNIEDADYFKLLPQILPRFGVGLVLVPYLPKTVYGAIRWFDGKPLIQISDRNHDLASCWFTLFHEFGHAILHKNVAIYEGSMNEPKSQKDKREREANKFANGYLFNGDDLRKTVFERKRSDRSMTAKELSAEFNVQFIFTTYWLMKAQYAPAFQRRFPIDFSSRYLKA